MESPLPDYYGLLQVHPRASEVVIKKAYRTLMASGAHPDAGGSSEVARLLSEAYAVLTDPDRRRAYDLAILMQPPEPVVVEAEAPAAPSPEAVEPGGPRFAMSPRRGALTAVLCLAGGLAIGFAGGYTAAHLSRGDAGGMVSADASYHIGAGIAFMEQVAAEKSEEHLRKAIAMSPEAPEPLSALGTLLARTDREDLALDAFERALAAYSREGAHESAAQMHARIADLAAKLGDRQRAIAQWQACYQHPGASTALKERARQGLVDLQAW